MTINHNQNPVLTMRDMGFDISVWFDRYDGDRSRYGYRIVGQDHRDGDPVYAEGDDLSECGDPDLVSALRSLLSFWSAAIESYPDGENASLFPAELLSLGIDSDNVTYTASWLGGES